MRLLALLSLLALPGCSTPPPIPLGLGDLAHACGLSGGMKPDTATGLTKPPPEFYGNISCKVA